MNFFNQNNLSRGVVRSDTDEHVGSRICVQTLKYTRIYSYTILLTVYVYTFYPVVSFAYTVPILEFKYLY